MRARRLCSVRAMHCRAKWDAKSIDDRCEGDVAEDPEVE